MAKLPRASKADWLLLVGALAGLGLAAYDVATTSARDASIPEDAVAVVNGAVISRADYERALTGLASGRRSGRLEEADPSQVLDRLIEEELLLQRAIEIGLAQSDHRARSAIVAAMIATIVAEADGEQETPSDDVLRRHLETHRDYFREPSRVRIRQIFFTGDAGDPIERARAARQRLLKGDAFDDVIRDGDLPPVPLPDTPLPIAKVLDYLGPTATRRAFSLDAGSVSNPVRSGWGVHLIEVVERSEATVRPLSEIRDEVLADYRRRAGDRRLRRYIDELRRSAKVKTSSEITE